MKQNQFQAIIFDNDGVLVDSEVIYVAVELDLLAEIGLYYDYSTYLSRFVGSSMPDYYRALAEDYTREVGGEFPTNFGEILSERVRPRIDAELKALPNVETVVRAFNGPVAVASSMPLKAIYSKLKLVGITDLFDPHIYSAEQVDKGKPAPALFLFTANHLGVEPEKCLVIEDSVNGVKAGVAAGMVVFGFDGGGHADEGLRQRLLEAGATHVFDNHNDIATQITDG